MISSYLLQIWRSIGRVSVVLGAAFAFPAFALAANPVSLTIAPSTPEISAGQTVQFEVTAKDASGQAVTNPALSWSLDQPQVGTIDAKGLFSGRHLGGAMVTVRSGSVIANTQVRVVSPADPLELALWPVGRDVTSDEYAMTSDESVLLEVLATDRYGNTWSATDDVVWSSTDDQGVFREGTYIPGRLGEATITATLGTLSDSNVILVKEGALASLRVVLSGDDVRSDETVELSAVGADADGHEWDATDNVVFITTDPTGSINGLSYEPGTAGEWNVIAEHGKIRGERTIMVRPSDPVRLLLQSPKKRVAVRGKITMEAAAEDNDGNRWDVTNQTRFQSRNGVFSGNVMTAKSAGLAMIIGQYADLEETFSISIMSEIGESEIQPTSAESFPASAPTPTQEPAIINIEGSESEEPSAGEEEPVEETPQVASGLIPLDQKNEEQGEVLGVTDETTNTNVNSASEAGDSEVVETEGDAETLSANANGNTNTAARTNANKTSVASTSSSNSSSVAWIAIGVILAVGLIAVGIVGLMRRGV